MAFPTGWARKCKLTIQSSLVGSTLTDFPVLVNIDTLPSEIFDADGSYPAQNGGGDIRFSSDSAGVTQLPCEVVSFVTDNNPANGSAEIWVKIPSVSSSADTDFYVWYNTTGSDSQPAVSDTYGRNAVWSDYAIVNHLSDGVDSTGNESNLTLTGTAAYIAGGKVGGALDISTGDSAYINNIAATLATSNPVSVQYWVYRDSDNTTVDYDEIHVLNRNGDGWVVGADAGQVPTIFTVGGNTISRSGGAAMSLAAWQQVHVVWDQSGATIDHYLGGSLDGSQVTSYGDTSSYSTGTAEWELGYDRTATPTGLDGKLDEVRYRKGALTADWVSADNSSQSSPGTFIIEGTPESTAAGAATGKSNPLMGVFGGPLYGPIG